MPKSKSGVKGKKRPQTNTEKLVKKELKRIRKETVEQYERIMYPVALSHAFMILIHASLLVAHDKFGFGKKRLTKFAQEIINQAECARDDYVSYKDIADEVFRITGIRFELTEEELKHMADEQMKGGRKL